MILDTMILENFGAYGGRQEANLTPEPNKPIILFGGMNGGGKTTLLDAIQLAFYGPKARLSNRGRSYRDYLRDSIHRGSDPGEGAGVTLRFRRLVEGETRHFELQRYWREGVKGIEETVRVLRDGKLDDVFTEHWDETIEAYLPSGIAHLFFFDGEQIKDLAEGGHAAEILGAAIHALLGVDLMDRLESDLKVFERRKKAEGLDAATAQALEQARAELQQIEQEQEQAAMQEGALVNQAGRLGKEQVLLLSTDEEIVGPYYEALQPFISRSYLLAHSDEQGMTNLEPGYFAKNAPIRGNDSVLSWRPEAMTAS
jgi:DNA sulfur modification protein DndD